MITLRASRKRIVSEARSKKATKVRRHEVSNLLCPRCGHLLLHAAHVSSVNTYFLCSNCMTGYQCQDMYMELVELENLRLLPR